MRCFVVIYGAGTILVLSTYKSAAHPDLVRRLKANGIQRVILMEVPLALAEERYGDLFWQMKAMVGPDNFRILDLNGASVFQRFSFKEMGQPMLVEF